MGGSGPGREGGRPLAATRWCPALPAAPHSVLRHTSPSATACLPGPKTQDEVVAYVRRRSSAFRCALGSLLLSMRWAGKQAPDGRSSPRRPEQRTCRAGRCPRAAHPVLPRGAAMITRAGWYGIEHPHSHSHPQPRQVALPGRVWPQQALGGAHRRVWGAQEREGACCLGKRGGLADLALLVARHTLRLCYPPNRPSLSLPLPFAPAPRPSPAAQVSFGVFETEEDAARQYDRALILEKVCTLRCARCAAADRPEGHLAPCASLRCTLGRPTSCPPPCPHQLPPTMPLPIRRAVPPRRTFPCATTSGRQPSTRHTCWRCEWQRHWHCWGSRWLGWRLVAARQCACIAW